MSLLAILRFFTTILSLIILAAAVYLLWSWNDGRMVRDVAGGLRLEREDWRLWSGLGLLAWSFLGGRILPLIIAKPDTRRTRATWGDGRIVTSRTGSSLWIESHGPAGAPPIIITHGWGMDSTFWCYAKQDLTDRFRLILWDLPGLGRSKASARDRIAVAAFAADLATVIEESGARPVVLVGHSIGGMTIQTLVRDHPQLESRIAGVVLLHTTYTNPLETMMFSRLLRALQRPVLEPAMKLTIALGPLVWLSNWQSYLSGWSHLAHRSGFGADVTRSQLEHVTLLATRNRPAVLARGDLATLYWDATNALRDLSAPVLVVGGDKDIVTKLEANRAIAGQTQLATLQVVEGANHMAPMERADIYNRMIADFALRVQPATSTDVRVEAPGEAPAPSPEPRSEPRDSPPPP